MPDPDAPALTLPDPAARARALLAGLPSGGLFDVELTHGAPCRIGPDPFPLPPAVGRALAAQGRLWLRLVRGAHALYLKSARGEAPAWIAEVLDAGKPRRIVEFARMNRFKAQPPLILRPDLLLTEAGAVACELDAVPGGFGLLGCLQRAFAAQGRPVLGGPDGMVDGFRAALERLTGRAGAATAIVVSEESRMYRPEMAWFAAALAASGVPAAAVRPEDLAVDGASVRAAGRPVEAVYRFFELFDLPQVAHGEALLEAAKLKHVRLTPPPKADLEEKAVLALLHHPALTSWWEAELGSADLAALRALVIPTWLLDPAPLPPAAVLAGFPPGGPAWQDWRRLATLTQRERSYILKPSGFSAEAWGSHGVRFGPDLSQEDWSRAVREALEGWPGRPHVLQPYVKPVRVRVPFYDPGTDAVRELDGRVRLTPYYFVTGEDEAPLGGVLATVCPADKKAIHGMPDAIMVPAAMAETSPNHP